jgi:hypothetical protein
MSAKLVTAHRLRDGVVLFYTGSDWSDFIGDAKVTDDADSAKALLAEAAATEKTDCLATGSYLIDVDVSGDVPRPTKLKEHVRVTGPTVRPDCAKHPDRQVSPFAN